MSLVRGVHQTQKQLRELYYITHVNNIPSIVSRGILSHERIKEEKIEAHVLAPLIAESFFHICKLSGKVAAETILATFLNTFPIKLVHLNQSLIIKAGLLKCQHAKILSYNDCFAIAYALNKKLTFHTTEKNIGNIFPTLRLKMYTF